MKKVLIITYYWPPSGGSGVQRWLKFVKYLPAFGWEPHVFTPENPSFAVRDPSFEKDVPAEAEVIRFPIWEPYDIFFSLSGWFGSKKEATPTALVSAKNRSLFQTISTWVRGNLFIPDPRRFWIKPSVEFLSDYLARNGIGTIITTGPPHSMHLIGLRLKRKYPHLRWMADFRDPWTEWGIWDSLMLSKPVRAMHRKLERHVLTTANDIIAVTPFNVDRFQRLTPRPVRLLTNGFDEDDFRALQYTKREQFTIRHIGVVNEKCDPRPFMEALEQEIQANPGFAASLRLEFVGEVHPDFRSFVGERRLLSGVTVFTGNIPHDALIALYGTTSLLLLVLTGYKDAEGTIPGKIFEYLGTRLPVLGVGPESGDVAALLREAGAGVMVESDNVMGIRAALQRAYAAWAGSAEPRLNPDTVSQYSRKALTGKLAELLADDDSSTGVSA